MDVEFVFGMDVGLAAGACLITSGMTGRWVAPAIPDPAAGFYKEH